MSSLGEWPVSATRSCPRSRAASAISAGRAAAVGLRTVIYLMIVPDDQIDAAVNRVPAGGNLVLQLLPLNHDHHRLAADLQHDHLARSHAGNLPALLFNLAAEYLISAK